MAHTVGVDVRACDLAIRVNVVNLRLDGASDRNIKAEALPLRANKAMSNLVRLPSQSAQRSDWKPRTCDTMTSNMT